MEFFKLLNIMQMRKNMLKYGLCEKFEERKRSYKNDYNE
jgi:hypothetical protein